MCHILILISCFTKASLVFALRAGVRRSRRVPAVFVSSRAQLTRAGAKQGADHGPRGGKGTLPALRPHVAEVRHTGIILVMQLGARLPYPWQERRGTLRLCPWPVATGAVAATRDVIYFMPPYVITEDQIRLMAEVATGGIECATAQ
jgi:adenosylmethionine-8-amino-7-oxononanoate aminotransferase